jgi:hypothetical protein
VSLAAFRPCLARPARNRHFSWPTFRRHLSIFKKEVGTADRKGPAGTSAVRVLR